MPKIQNVAGVDVAKGFHYDCGENSMLIQILDTCPSYIPSPAHKFKEVHRFEFLDLNTGEENAEEFGINPLQARELVSLLKHALEQDMNVVVHCTAGICRSGAVVEVATLMGFKDPCCYRAPNLRVKHFMMRELGLTYDSAEKHYISYPDPNLSTDFDIQYIKIS